MTNIAASRRYIRYEPKKKNKIDEITICSGLKKENVTTKSTPCNLLHREITHNISTFVPRTICIF